MRDLKTDLYDAAFDMWNMAPSDDLAGYGPAGERYVWDNRYGHGCYWVYFRSNLFAVNAFDMYFADSGAMVYPHAEHLSVGVYECGAGAMHAEGHAVIPHTVQTYIAEEGGTYRAAHRGNVPIRGASITISPDYYRDALSVRFGDVPDVRRAFELVDGAHDFYELVDLLKSARAYQGTGLAADLFYEGVVAEAMALIIDRAAEVERHLDEQGSSLARDDRAMMSRLAVHIVQHLDDDLSCEALARRACMGQTKFKAAFRSYFGCTPKAYVTRARMERARELLRDDRLSVAQVAHAVGYRKPGAFTQAFRRSVGLAPSEVRAGR